MDLNFQGSVVVGTGFVLDADEGQKLIDANPKNNDVILPYLNGEDFNSSAEHEPRRFSINFFDWPLKTAETYSEPMKIVRERVYPFRSTVNREAHRKYWWHYGDKRPALYQSISKLSRVLVVARVTKNLAFGF